MRLSERESTVASAPSPSTSARFSSLDASPITRAPALFAIWTESDPVPPAAASTTTVSPASTRAQTPDQRHRGQPLEEQRGGLVVVDLVGDRDEERLGDRHLLGVAAAAQQRRDAAPVGGAAADLAAGDHRQ